MVTELESDLEGGPTSVKMTKDKSGGEVMPRKIKLTMVEVKDSPTDKPKKFYVLTAEDDDGVIRNT